MQQKKPVSESEVGKAPAAFITTIVRVFSIFYVGCAFFLMGNAVYIREMNLFYRLTDPRRNHELALWIAAILVMIVAFTNIYSINHAITRGGRVMFNLFNVIIFVLALSSIFLDDMFRNNAYF